MNYTIQPYTNERFSEIIPLYEAVGWTNYTNDLAMLQKAYEHSLVSWLAIDESNNVIGVVRAVGDGHSIIYVQDLIVDPTCHRQGIGTKLLQTVLTTFKDAYQIILSTDALAKNKQFYRNVGFVEFAELSCTSFIYVAPIAP